MQDLFLQEFIIYLGRETHTHTHTMLPIIFFIVNISLILFFIISFVVFVISPKGGQKCSL